MNIFEDYYYIVADKVTENYISHSENLEIKKYLNWIELNNHLE